MCLKAYHDLLSVCPCTIAIYKATCTFINARLSPYLKCPKFNMYWILKSVLLWNHYSLFIINNYLFIYKMYFYRQNLYDSSLAATEVRQKLSWWRHIDEFIATRDLLRSCRGWFAERGICIWMYLHVILCSVKQLRIDNLHVFFLVYRQHFLLRLSPAPLIACLNGAAWSIKKPESKM